MFTDNSYLARVLTKQECHLHFMDHVVANIVYFKTNEFNGF